ncbi:sensor histidine kinase [Nostocoides sp. HKS02]|uniref:sensor histidine kinase n=1 Tax=Nostocoides sp. HKS02 TaxID=1813880 RepID=UPI0018A81A0F|nr:sensor histidine kinase [Tetrasphaera sp. HKS02]
MQEPEQPPVSWGPPWRHARSGWPRHGFPWPARVFGAGLLVVVQVGGTFGAAHVQPTSRPVDAAAVGLLLAAPVSMLLIRRYAWLAALLAGGATAAFFARGYPFGPIIIGFAAVVVITVLRGLRPLAWAVVAGVLLTATLTRVGGEHGPNWQVLGGLVAWAGVILAVGELVRVRRDRAVSSWQASQERRRRQAGEERLRIAQELHDVVAHHMSLITVQAGVALHLAERRPETVEPALRAIKDASKEALGELRSLIDLLRDDENPAPRAPAPTLAAIDDIVERSSHAGLTVTKDLVGQPRPLPAAVELAAYRIVQEGITNVVRHANATRVAVVIGYADGALTVRIDDNGLGGPRATRLEPGNGLRGMHERAAALGGDLQIGAAPDGGLRVEARLPTRETR